VSQDEGSAAPRIPPILAYYLIAGLFTLASALIWGVNTLFLLDAGLDIQSVFLANAAFTAGMVLFEIPTGVFADTVGRRASFLLSVSVLAVTTAAYALAPQMGAGLLAFAVISVVMGLGFTFYTGAVEAWLVDALNHAGYSGKLDRVLARGSMVSGAAMLVGTLAGGVLGDVDLALPYVARTIMLVGALAVAWMSMHDVGFSPRALRLKEVPAEMRRIATESVRHGWGQRPVRLLMFVSFLQWGFMSWGFYAWQPYFLQLLGRDAVWAAGAAASAFAGAMIVGNAVVDQLSAFCGRRTTLLLWAGALQGAAAVVVGLAGNFWVALAGMGVLAAGIGMTGPVKQAYLHARVPSAQRASVISFDSMFGNGGGVAGQAGLGWLSRTRSIEDGYVLGGLVIMLALPLYWMVRRVGGAADVIVGNRASVAAPCAAQGIPEIAGIDAKARSSTAVGSRT
jgi:MFS family permease